MGHLRELYQIQKKLWKGFLRMSEVADFVAIEWPKRCAYWGWNQTRDFLETEDIFNICGCMFSQVEPERSVDQKDLED